MVTVALCARMVYPALKVSKFHFEISFHFTHSFHSIEINSCGGVFFGIAFIEEWSLSHLMNSQKPFFRRQNAFQRQMVFGFLFERLPLMIFLVSSRIKEDSTQPKTVRMSSSWQACMMIILRMRIATNARLVLQMRWYNGTMRWYILYSTIIGLLCSV